MRYFLLLLIISALIITSFQTEKESVKRLENPSISKQILEVIPHIIEFNDTISNDTLWEHTSKNKIPIMYSRNVVTEVCINGECRLVNIGLFWNITGRYLGFVLPKGEFLSKTEHVKFNSTEYDRLHYLLGDPLSALANYSLKELVPAKDSAKTKVDAVSSATIAAVLDYIVEGAVYTTYTLWHIVYGPTKREIEKQTAEKLNSDIVLELLNSNKLEDQVWTLNHISGKMEISSALQNKLMEIISGDDIYLAAQSLNAITPEALTVEIQRELSAIFDKASFLQKRLIIQKLKESPTLHSEIATHFSKKLKTLNGTLTKNVLELFQVHQIKNKEIILEVGKLLANKNRFIAKQAFLFLEGIDNPDRQTLKSINKYKTRKR